MAGLLDIPSLQALEIATALEVVVEVASSDEVVAYEAAIRTLVRACFPREFGTEVEGSIFGVLAGFHDLVDCEWLLVGSTASLAIALSSTRGRS